MKIFKRLTMLSSLALLLCATQLQAADIDLATAKNVAKSFMAKQVTNGQLKAEAASNLKLVKAEIDLSKFSVPVRHNDADDVRAEIRNGNRSA